MVFKFLEDYLDDRAKQQVFRETLPLHTVAEKIVQHEHLRMHDFCSNDYLGFRSHPHIRQHLQAYLEKKSAIGSGSAALLSGYSYRHEELEDRLAQWLGCEKSLLFGSGFLANYGLISSLGKDRETHIFSDASNHASIIDGCRNAQAKVHVFKNVDLNHLKKLLEEHHSPEPHIIISETIFSMDGHLAHINGIRSLAEASKCIVIWDEAHALGVRGINGEGLIAEHGGPKPYEIIVGTCGKALGSAGAFVAGPSIIRKTLVNHCRSYIFTTSLSPLIVEAIHSSLDLLNSKDQENYTKTLTKKRALFSKLWKAQGLPSHGESAIYPLIIGDSHKTTEISKKLANNGFFVRAIRPPTVPPGTSRLRINLSATHEVETLHSLCKNLQQFYEMPEGNDIKKQ